MTGFRTQPGLRGVMTGPDCVTSELAAELERQGVTRPLVVCGANVARSPVMATVREALAAAPLIFPGSLPHTPVETVDDGAEAGRAGRVDGLIAVGGSSAVDCAKGIAVLLATGHRHVADLTPAAFGRLGDPFDGAGGPPVALLMVTTTLSFAEFLPFWGVRRTDLGRKVAYPDYGRVMRTVFLDGGVAAHTPDSVWAETGVKALDDAISAFCRSGQPEPFLDPILIQAIGDLIHGLPASLGSEGTDARRRSRQDVLTSTWMTKFPLPRLGPVTTTGWFSTAARHALGGVWALPHGVGSCVSLVEGLGFHASATGSRQAALATALGWAPPDNDGTQVGVRLSELLDALGVPTRLGECGIAPDGLGPVIEHMLAESPQLGTYDEIARTWQQMR
ncbi:MAG TPA: iron-containing alcohol dehydrogenase [Acidimicrobiales bacterium]|jgi:alcohol dehydrogenase class IV